jgi:hypothetical protein
MHKNIELYHGICWNRGYPGGMIARGKEDAGDADEGDEIKMSLAEPA